MVISKEWERSPLDGRWLLFATRRMSPRAEVRRVEGGGYVATLFVSPDGDGSTIGTFPLLAVAQATAELALARVTEAHEELAASSGA